MAKYRRRPVVMEAEQWTAGKQVAGVCTKDPDGVGLDWMDFNIANTMGDCLKVPHVHTLEGPLKVSDGDWIMTGIQGEHWPVKPDIFEKTYEPVIEFDFEDSQTPADTCPTCGGKSHPFDCR